MSDGEVDPEAGLAAPGPRTARRDTVPSIPLSGVRWT